MNFLNFFIILISFNFISTNEIDPKILGGTPSILTSSPSCFVTIFVNFEDTNRRCGGCVIPSGDRILTSASCISSPLSDTLSSNLNFAFGVTSILRPLYSMVNVTKNPNFDVNSRNSSDDIAVIKLNRNAIKLNGVDSAKVCEKI